MSDPLPLVVANHKANETWDELAMWLTQVSEAVNDFPGTVLVCPSMAFLSEASQKIKDTGSKLKIGSQNISQFEKGAYTGEVAASQIADQVSYSIIGHSERRQHFGETDEIVAEKVKVALKAQITPIFCVQDKNTLIPSGVEIIAYEPIFAIGTGNPDTPENTMSIGKSLKAKGSYTVLYGGSVDANNVKSYLQGTIDGILVGSASLDAEKFISLIKSI